MSKNVFTIKMMKNSANFSRVQGVGKKRVKDFYFCRKLESGCQIPIGSYAILKKNKIWLRGLVGSPNGKIILKGERIGCYNTGEKMGYSLADELLSNGAKNILNNLHIKQSHYI